jgi:hypothetical protein
VQANRSLLQPAFRGKQVKETMLNPMAMFIDVLRISLLFNCCRSYLVFMA